MPCRFPQKRQTYWFSDTCRTERGHPTFLPLPTPQTRASAEIAGLEIAWRFFEVGGGDWSAKKTGFDWLRLASDGRGWWLNTSDRGRSPLFVRTRREPSFA